MQNNLQSDSVGQNGYDMGGQASPGDKNTVGQFPFLKTYSGEKKQTKDGQPAKRRGPKPDSKPALTRRQELNRQAQRTHRERKEMYIKALEQEVLRLKEVFAESTRERDKVQQENARLKALLSQHGISYDFAESPVKFQRAGSNSYGPSSSGSISGSYQPPSESTDLSPPPPSNGLAATMPNHMQTSPQGSARMGGILPNNNLNYDQIGIDFVLTYDSQGRPIRQTPAPVPYPSPPPQAQHPM